MFTNDQPLAVLPPPPPRYPAHLTYPSAYRLSMPNQPQPGIKPRSICSTGGSFQYQSSVSASPSEVVAATPDDLSVKVEEGGDGRPVVLSMPYVTGKLEKEGVVQPGMVSWDGLGWGRVGLCRVELGWVGLRRSREGFLFPRFADDR